jgi:type I restriction enzyme S subunit
MAGDNLAGWRELSIEDCMEAIIDYRGKTPRKTSFGIPLVTAKIVKNGCIETPEEFIAPTDYETWMRRGLPRPGDVVITTEAPLGEVAQLDGSKVALAQRIIALRGRPNTLDNLFLKYSLQSSYVQEQLRARASGTTVLGIKQSELRRVTLMLPPISEQRAIADILGPLDDRIALNRRMNETLEAMARALFKSWFVDFDPVRAKAEGRTPTGMDAEIGELFPSEFVDGQMGAVPKGWAAVPLYDIATYVNGAAYAAFQPNGDRRGLPIVKIAELKAGVTDQTKFSDVEMPAKYRLSTGEILFSWSGNPDTSIDTFVWTHGPAWLNQHIFRVQPHRDEERSWVMSTLKYLRPVFAEIARNRQTTGLGHVTAGDMKRLLVVRPTSRIILAWAKTVGPVIERVFRNMIEGQHLARVRDVLLPALLSGEISVPAADTALEAIA